MGGGAAVDPSARRNDDFMNAALTLCTPGALLVVWLVVHTLAAWARAIAWSIETGSPSVGAFFVQSLGMPDWLDAEIVIVFAMCAGGVWAMVKEGREHRRDASERIELHARLAAVETAIGNGEQTIAERVAALEAQPALGDLPERVSKLESQYDYAERLHAIEARLAARAPRDPKGRFAGAVTCEDPTR